MKTMRITGIIAAISCMLAFVVSCASTQESARSRDLPKWYLNPPAAEESIYGVGSANMSTLDMSRTTAISRARDDVARQVTIVVQNAIKDYAQEAGADGKTQTLQFTETISKQIANVCLEGCTTEEVVQGKDGTMYALVTYQVRQLKDESHSQFRRSEEAAWAEFKAHEAERWLDNELRKNPPQSNQ